MMGIMKMIMKKTFNFVIIMLITSLTIYIMTGFLGLFFHKPSISIEMNSSQVSAFLGSIASVGTLIIAARAVLVAKKWHSEKIRAELFESALRTFNFARTLPLTILIIEKELKLRKKLLNLKCKNMEIDDKKLEILRETKDLLKNTDTLRMEILKDITESVRFNNYFTKEYKSFLDSLQNGASSYLGNLDKPFTLSKNGCIKIRKKLRLASKEINRNCDNNSSKVYNALGDEKLSGFIDLPKMVKDSTIND